MTKCTNTGVFKSKELNIMKKIFFLLSLTFIVSYSFSQSQIIFEKNTNESFLIRYTNGQNSIKNTILQKMAKANSVPVSNISIKFSYKQNCKILKKGNQIEFLVTVKEIKVTENNMYKDFKLRKLLIPASLSFKMQHYKGKKLIKTYDFNNININNRTGIIVNKTVADSSNSKNHTIKITNKDFNYSQENQRMFNNRTRRINQYYTENKNIRNYQREINVINADEHAFRHLSDINVLYGYQEKANNSLNYIKQVKGMEFYKNMNLQNFDPKALNRKLNSLEQKSINLLNACNNILDHLDQIYYDKGMKNLARRDIVKAEYFFNKAIKFNKEYAPAQFQLAVIYYRKGNTDWALEKIFEIINMNPDYDTRAQTVELAQGIYKDFLLEASDLNSRKRYDDALVVLDNAHKLCHDFPDVLCLRNMDDEYQRAISGKFNFILEDIDIAINSNKLNDAEKFIKDAKRFQRHNSLFIPNTNDIALRVNDLYMKYISKGKNNINRRLYENALKDLEEAKRICRNYREINCTPELDNTFMNARTGVYKNLIQYAENSFRANKLNTADKQISDAVSYRNQYNLSVAVNENKLLIDIKTAIYKDYINKGRNQQNARNYESALGYFDNAVTIENNYSVVKDRNLNGYITASAESLIIQKVNFGKDKVKINDLRTARSSYSESKSLLSKYNLSANSAAGKAIKELKDMIFEQECINAQNEYNSFYSDALNKISQRKYLSADNKLNDALNHARNNIECEINTDNVNDKKREIAPVVDYLTQLNEIDTRIKRRDYQSAINYYIQSGNFFNSNNVSKFNIKHLSLVEFIESKHSPFVNYSVSYYTGKKDYNTALKLLKVLRSRNYVKRATKDNQTVLGTKLAIKDYSDNPNGNYKVNIAGYTGSDSFFKFFEKAYKKQWKKLD